MARGTTTDYLTTQVTAKDILEDSLRMIGALKPGQTLADAHDIPRMLRVLNSLIKRDAQDGLHSWALTEGVLFLTADKARYTFGTDKVGTAATYVRTTISSLEASGQTQLSVTDSTGMTAADIVAVELDDGTLHWSTISSVGSETAITIAAALTDDAAAGNAVYSYTTAGTTPLKIIPGTIRLESDLDEQSLVWLVSRSEYFSIYDKTLSGIPNRCFLDRQYNAAYLYLWPVPESVSYTLRFTYQRELYDLDTYRDDIDIPPEAAMYYTKAMAAELGTSFGVPLEIIGTLKQEAAQERSTLFGTFGESGSLYIRPSLGQ